MTWTRQTGADAAAETDRPRSVPVGIFLKAKVQGLMASTPAGGIKLRLG